MIRILIADDHPILRAGLRTLLAECEDMTVSGEAASGDETIRMVRSGQHDIVLLDITLPDMNGVDALKLIKRHRPSTAVLILSMHPEEQYVVNLLRAGASGYVPKEAAPEQLVAAIRTVMNGRRYVSAALADVLARDLSDPEQQPSHSALSEREFQIFCKLAEGMSVSQIAANLNLSVKTISTYRARILEKMALRNNADLISYAIKNRLVQ